LRLRTGSALLATSRIGALARLAIQVKSLIASNGMLLYRLGFTMWLLARIMSV